MEQGFSKEILRVHVPGIRSGNTTKRYNLHFKIAAIINDCEEHYRPH